MTHRLQYKMGQVMSLLLIGVCLNRSKTIHFNHSDGTEYWMHTIMTKGWHKRVLAHFSAGINSPVFDDQEVQMMRNSLNDLLQQHGLPIDWNIPEHQPLTLHILSSLPQLINDPDKDLFYNLINGVPTGFKQDIPTSHCFAPVDRDEDAMHEPLSVHLSSWKSAHDDEAVTDELIQIELDRGWAGAP
jgi:hypothetical protein